MPRPPAWRPAGGRVCRSGRLQQRRPSRSFHRPRRWLPIPIRPTLLRNNGNGTFTDVTEEAGLLDPVNSISASWADYDNDGWLDLFICCERQTSRLYHNLGNGTFEEVARHRRRASRRPNTLQRFGLDRLRQRRFPGPVSGLSRGTGAGASCFTTTATGRFAMSRRK